MFKPDTSEQASKLSFLFFFNLYFGDLIPRTASQRLTLACVALSCVACSSLGHEPNSKSRVHLSDSSLFLTCLPPNPISLQSSSSSFQRHRILFISCRPPVIRHHHNRPFVSDAQAHQRRSRSHSSFLRIHNIHHLHLFQLEASIVVSPPRSTLAALPTDRASGDCFHLVCIDKEA